MVLDFDALQASFSREKDREKALVLKSILHGEDVTRKRIIQELSLRPSTVSKIIAELIEDGIVSESQNTVREGRGRPEAFLKVHPGRFWSISYSIMSVGLLGVAYDIEGRAAGKVEKRLSTDLDAERMIGILDDATADLSESVPRESEFLGFGLALPGLLDRKRNTWRTVSRFPNLKHLSFERIRKGRDGIISIERNIDALLRYYLLTVPEYGRGTTLLLHWGYGIAVSCAMEGTILQAPNGLFGEIGHWDVDVSSERTKGYLEEKAALSEVLTKQGWRDDIDESDIESLVSDGIFPAEELARIREMMQKVTKNLYLTFFPDRFLILSPFVSPEMSRELEASLKRQLPDFVDPAPRVTVLTYGEQGESVGIANTVFSASLREYLKARW